MAEYHEFADLKSTRHLAQALTKGHPISDRTVARRLRWTGFSLQANTKGTESAQHADRDTQFGYLAGQVGEYLGAGAPVISVDTKKKKLVGDLGNGRPRVPPGRCPRAGQHPRLPRHRTGQGHPLRHLRPFRQHRHLGIALAETDSVEQIPPLPRVADPGPKIVLGTDFPQIPYAYAHQIQALDRLGLGDAWMRAVLWDNGARLMRPTV